MSVTRKNVDNVVEKFVPENMIVNLYNAAKNVRWHGVDGVKSILYNDRMKALKRKGKVYHEQAMLKCMAPICDAAIETKDITMLKILSEKDRADFAKNKAIKAKVQEVLQKINTNTKL